MRHPNYPKTRVRGALQEYVIRLSNMESYLGDTALDKLLSLYKTGEIDVGSYSQCVTDLNTLVAERLIESGYKVDGKFKPVLAPRGVAFIQNYIPERLNDDSTEENKDT